MGEVAFLRARGQVFEFDEAAEFVYRDIFRIFFS